MPPNAPIKAYSYLRFSTPEQMKGDSFRRQSSLAMAYAQQHGLELDESLTFHDLGVSAFRGDNLETGQLAAFKEAVQSGRVQRGSYLLVESLDRVSRMAPWLAVGKLSEIISLDITIVSLVDGLVYGRKELNENPMALMMAVMSFIRANQESEVKARRIKQAWIGKREKALTKGEKLTAAAPAWLKLNESRDGFIVIEERAEVVREIFQELARGVGLEGIAKDLNRRQVPVFGRGQQWHRSYIQKLRDNPAVMGTFVPHQESHGEGGMQRLPLPPIPGYFPAIVDPALFESIQAMVAGRVPKAPAKTGIKSILAGLAKCPACGSTMTRITKGNAARGGKPKLVCSRAKVGAGCQYRGVILEQVEQAIRGQIEPLLAMPPLADETADKALEVSRTALEVVEEELQGLVRLAAQKPMRSVLERLDAMELERDRLKKDIAEMEEAAALTNHAAVQYRAENLLDILKVSPADVAQINAGLRSLFNAVVVDYTTGQLRFQWKSGQESSIIFAWVE